MDNIEVFVNPSFETSSSDDDPDNPLSRAVNRLLADGKPLNSIAPCFYKPIEPSTQNIIRWLGVFIHSAGNRIIFFPGLSISPTLIHTYRGLLNIRNAHFQIDHVSLEDGFEQCHFTSSGSKDHLHAGCTENLGKGQYLWFGLSVLNSSQFRPVNKTILRAPSPPSDIQRRMKKFVNAMARGKGCMISLDSRALLIPEPNFLHFSFIVLHKCARKYQGRKLLIPFGAPFISKLPSSLLGIPVRTSIVRLDHNIRIQINAMQLPGKMKVPFAYYNPR